jgi:VWFA-related protein
MKQRVRLVTVFGLLGLMMVSLSGQQTPPPAPPPPAQTTPPAQTAPSTQTPPPAQPAQGAQPSFRTGATFVRVDAFVTKGGVPVEDLKAEDFVVKEDGVPQKVQSFEYVHIPNAAYQTGERRDPNTVEQMREQVSDPRRRVFVIFLDTYHVTQGSAMRTRSSLLKFLQRIVGPDDLVAGMTPEMEPDALAFGSRTESLEGVLNGIWARRSSVIETPEEEAMKSCYPPDQNGNQTWPAARDRRRAKLSMDAMEGLVRHLASLREERKAIITITEGWQLERVNLNAMANPGNPNLPPSGPTVGVGPGGRLGTSNRNPGGSISGDCDSVRMEIAGMDTVQQFRDLPDEANRANATFYTVDPRGLAAFDADLGPDRPPSILQDAANLRSKLDMLRELAERTDGLAAVNSNDMDKQLKRIADDVSSYYLLGYDSTNPKLDGKYRTINVRVTRPGVQVRARRGYRANTEDAVTMTGPASGSGTGGAASDGGSSGAARAGGAGGGSGAGASGGSGTRIASASKNGPRPTVATPEERMTAQITGAVGALTSTRGDVPLRTRVVYRRGAGAGELRIVSELNGSLAASDAWKDGGTARVIVRGASAGQDLVTAEAKLNAGTRVMEATIPLTVAPAAGDYKVLLRLTAQSKIDAVSDTVPLAITAENTHQLPEPAVLRRGPSTGMAYAPTADLRFTRQERIRLEWPETSAPDTLDVSLVNQRGDALKLPAQVSAREDNGARVSVVDFAFAPLAPGGYALLVREKDQARETSTIVPLQVIP